MDRIHEVEFYVDPTLQHDRNSRRYIPDDQGGSVESFPPLAKQIEVKRLDARAEFEAKCQVDMDADIHELGTS